MIVPFNSPLVLGDEGASLDALVNSGRIGGGGEFTKKCEKWLREELSAPAVFLTSSCSGALEMAVILAGIGPGDEVIMPSFTFPSMANAVALRGGVPVFVDIRQDTLNIDEDLIENAIGRRTKAIMPMHYGGISCDMDRIMAIGERYGLFVIEDAAHTLLARCRGRPVGRAGHLAALSFHETKNIHCGEGGALIVNLPGLVGRAEAIREKGTNRSAFLRGEVDKYRWVELGSSFAPSELQAAWLFGQLQSARQVTEIRMRIWDAYHEGLESLEKTGKLRRPVVPRPCQHNAHLYPVIVRDPVERDRLKAYLCHRGIGATFHFVPLHDSPAGRRYGRTAGELPVTEALSNRLLRLPVWVGMEDHVDAVLAGLYGFFGPKPHPGRRAADTTRVPAPIMVANSPGNTGA